MRAVVILLIVLSVLLSLIGCLDRGCAVQKVSEAKENNYEGPVEDPGGRHHGADDRSDMLDGDWQGRGGSTAAAHINPLTYHRAD
jgi:hypothetical protein